MPGLEQQKDVLFKYTENKELSFTIAGNVEVIGWKLQAKKHL